MVNDLMINDARILLTPSVMQSFLKRGMREIPRAILGFDGVLKLLLDAIHPTNT